jgi:hypothetical protein
MADLLEQLKRYARGTPAAHDIELPLQGRRDPRLSPPSGIRAGFELTRDTVRDQKRKAVLAQMKGK